MKPLILQYTVSPEAEPIITEMLSYCDRQNLNIIKSTGLPAVYLVSQDTDTFTKAHMDTNECDNNYRVELQGFLDTQMQTRALRDTNSDPGLYDPDHHA